MSDKHKIAYALSIPSKKKILNTIYIAPSTSKIRKLLKRFKEHKYLFSRIKHKSIGGK